MSFDKIKNMVKLTPNDNNSIQDIMQKQMLSQISPSGTNFDAIMQRVEVQAGKDQGTTVDIDNKIENRNRSLPSVMEEVSKLGGTIGSRREDLSMDRLISTNEKALKTIAQAKETLSNPNIQLKDSVQNLMKNKLSNIDDNVKIALSKVGAEYEPKETSRVLNPAKRLLGMLSYSQQSLQAIGTKIESMAASGEGISPGQMLSVQIKMHTVAQEMEFFTSLLSKSIESVKTVMNVQV